MSFDSGDKATLHATWNGGGDFPVRVLKVDEFNGYPVVQVRVRKRYAPAIWVLSNSLTKDTA
jgi:hypothetical protein